MQTRSIGPHALRFKLLLQRLLRLDDQERTYLLITDPQFVEWFSRDRRADWGRRQQGRSTDQKVPPVHRYLPALLPQFALVFQFCPFQGTSQASRRRMAKVNAKAQAAMIPMPTKTTSVARNWDADMMR